MDVPPYFMIQRITKTTVDGWVRETSVDSYMVPDDEIEKLGKNTSAMLRHQWDPDADRANKLIKRVFEILSSGENDVIDNSRVFHSRQYVIKTDRGYSRHGFVNSRPLTITGVFIASL
jgi:hypothetical protein